MHRERKSKSEAKAIGANLRRTRKACGLTLHDLQRATAVNVGQISRLETGQFVFASTNLQKVLSFLQRSRVTEERHAELLHRFATLLERSPQHKVAATALLAALEGLR